MPGGGDFTQTAFFLCSGADMAAIPLGVFHAKDNKILEEEGRLVDCLAFHIFIL
jgi:hypothetical protein